jgi:hypothetical protein
MLTNNMWDWAFYHEYAELITPTRQELSSLHKALKEIAEAPWIPALEIDPSTKTKFQYSVNGALFTLEELEDEIKWANKAYDLLQTMGVDSPLDLSIEQAKAVYTQFGGQIADLLTSMGHPDPYRERNYN